MTSNDNLFHMTCNSVYDNMQSGVRIQRKHYNGNTEIRHFHDFFELVFVESGTALHFFGGMTRKISRGDVLLIPPGTPHNYQDIDELEIVNLLYLPDLLALPHRSLCKLPGYVAFFESQLTGCGSALPLSLPPEKQAEFEQLIEAMYDEQTRRIPGFTVALNARFLELVLLLSRAAGEKLAETIPLCWTRLLPYCREHLAEPLTVADLARVCSLSVRSLERLFAEETGRPPGEFLRNLRLDHAAGLLAGSEEPVEKVAQLCGFSDSGYLARSFRKRFGLSPRAYRIAQTTMRLSESGERSQNGSSDAGIHI